MGKPEPGAQLLPRAWGKAHAEMRQPLTVCSSAFNATISSIDFKDRNWFVLSAILLKQWRVPSTLNLACLLTKSFTSSTESAAYKFSVLFSKLPAQFFIFVSGSRAKSGETKGPAAIVENSLRNCLLSMLKAQLPFPLVIIPLSGASLFLISRVPLTGRIWPRS